MEENQQFVTIPAEDLRLFKAQLQQVNIDAQNNAQNHAREIADLRNQHQAVFQQQANRIHELEASLNNHGPRHFDPN